MPQNLNEKTPALETLILDGNRIENIEFVNPLKLDYLSISHMPTLKFIGSKAFRNIGKFTHNILSA